MKKIRIIRSLLALALASTVLLAACSGGGKTDGSGSGSGDGETTHVKVGVVGADSKTWKHIAAEAAKENIEIEVIYFDSYPLPNAALDAGEIQLNNFQHYSYLNKEIERSGYKLTAIGETVIAPLGLYSDQIERVDELEDGARIIIPDDETNGGRALLLLQENGLITVDPEAGDLPSLKDTLNPRNFDIVEMAATNIPASLDEVPLVVLNSGVAQDAGLIPTEDAIVLEEVRKGENPYINIIVARTEDKDNPVYLRIVELYQTDEVAAIIAEDSKGSSIPVWNLAD